MQVTLPYGKEKVKVEIPEKNFIRMMDPDFTRALKGKRGGTMVLASPNYEGMGPHPGYAECMGSDSGDDMVNACIRGAMSST